MFGNNKPQPSQWELMSAKSKVSEERIHLEKYYY